MRLFQCGGSLQENCSANTDAAVFAVKRQDMLKIIKITAYVLTQDGQLVHIGVSDQPKAPQLFFFPARLIAARLRKNGTRSRPGAVRAS